MCYYHAIFTVNVYSQNISVIELTSILNRPIAETNKILISNRWEFYKDDKDSDFKNAKSRVYGVNERWRTLKYDGPKFRQVRYTFNSEAEFVSIISYFRSVQAEEKSKRETENLIIAEYMDKGLLGYIYTVVYVRKKGNAQQYLLTVMSKAAYVVFSTTQK